MIKSAVYVKWSNSHLNRFVLWNSHSMYANFPPLRHIPNCYDMLSVCLLSSVTWVNCDKMTEVRITRFDVKVACGLISQRGTFDGEIRRGFPWLGAQTRVMCYVSKLCEIELKWQLITNRKSYVSFRLQQKSLTLNDLERQFTDQLSALCMLWPNGCG